MSRQNSVAVLEVARGEAVESKHEVDIVVADVAGNIVESWGDKDRLLFPRSAIKALQALALVESGAADAANFRPEHLALACSSHNGEEVHVKAARDMLHLAGLAETCLECGAQLPRFPEDQLALARAGVEPTSVHNNCSGKHAGLLAFSKHQGFETTGYVDRKHPTQAAIAGILDKTLDHPHTENNVAIDGCSIPTYEIPLKNLATAYAKFGVGEGGGVERSRAMNRIREACTVHPEMVAGKNRVCTTLMQILGEKAFVKIGAEGVYTASLPAKGFGIGLKVRDGADRASETAIAALIARYLNVDGEAADKLGKLAEPVLKNRMGKIVGAIRLIL